MTAAERKTVAGLPRCFYDEAVGEVADRGSRRYHPFSFDCNSGPLSLGEIPDHWEEDVKAVHRENREREIKWLELDYGSHNLDVVIKNSIDLGPKGMSIIAHHNVLHEQARRAFVSGSYFPALVGACALGERMTCL